MASRSMGRNASSVGMMEGAFFVGRTELLEWVNGLLSVNLTKVEQCASGAVYCQIVDACHPGSVKMAKVNWMAKVDHEYIPNFKILQAAFDRNNIEKHIDVDKLIRAKYQDNLEFLQWMKALADREGAGRQDYEPVSTRGARPMPIWAKAVEGALGRVTSAGEKENQSANREQVASQKDKFDPRRRAAATNAAAKAAPARGTTPRSGARPGVAPAARMTASDVEWQQKVEDQAEELNELRNTLDGLENERDYYFQKLRNVEILCTTLQAKMDPSLDVNGMLSQVLGILYAENDEAAGEGENLDAAVGPPLEAPELPTFDEQEVAVA